MNPLTTVLIVVSVCAIIGAIVAIVAWRKADVRATRLRDVNRELSGQLTQAYELPQVASRLGVLNHVAMVFEPREGRRGPSASGGHAGLRTLWAPRTEVL